jgi:hypothetical protein
MPSKPLNPKVIPMARKQLAASEIKEDINLSLGRVGLNLILERLGASMP